MTVRIDGVVMPPDEHGLREVRLFAYAVRDEGATDTDLRDGNHCREIVGRLSGDGITDGTPPDGVTSLWRVSLRVWKSRRGRSEYALDYFKFPGCPLSCAAEMMDLFHDVKRVLRTAKKNREQKNKEQER